MGRRAASGSAAASQTRQVRVELRARRDGAHLAAPLHLAIPRQLRLRHRPRLLGRVPAGQPVAALHVARDLRRDDHADASAAQLVERHRAAPAVGPVGHAGLALADLVDGPRQVAVPLDGVHGQVEMGVENHALRCRGVAMHDRPEGPAGCWLQDEIQPQHHAQRDDADDRLHHRPRLQRRRHVEAEVFLDQPEAAVVDVAGDERAGAERDDEQLAVGVRAPPPAAARRWPPPW